jgi:hypothetical protein
MNRAFFMQEIRLKSQYSTAHAGTKQSSAVDEDFRAGSFVVVIKSL